MAEQEGSARSSESSPRSSESSARVSELVEERVQIEKRLQNERGELAPAVEREYDAAYGRLQRSLTQTFRDLTDEPSRITVMLELMRILENKLVYLHNFIVDPTSDHRNLAGLVVRFIDQMSGNRTVLSPLEATYYRAIAALYAGDVSAAREGFLAACESEESDEANDIKYKSYVILGNLSHEAQDYAGARELHDRSLQYSQNNPNVTAQALAFKALNEYALGQHDEALDLFEKGLALFDRDQPFFNSYFHRNALLFCGAIHFDRKSYERAGDFYARVVKEVEADSFDHFDALSHLGKIAYARNAYDEAAEFFERAVGAQGDNENEYIVDTYFWLARTHLQRDDRAEAKKYLERITASDVVYEKKPQAQELLARVAG